LSVKIIKIKSLRRNVYFLPDFSAFFQIYRLIKRNKYHLVHTHQSKAGFLGRVAAKLAGVSLVVHTLHGPLFFEGQNILIKQFYILLEKFAAIFTDWFICVGEDLKNYYLEKGVGKKEKYSVIRSAQELEKFQHALRLPENEIEKIKKSLGIINKSPVIGMVGRLEKSKGWEEAIEVAKEVAKKHPEVKFLFVGKGNFRSFLEKKVARLKLQQNIIFTGFKKNIEKIIMVFDVLILTTPREGLPQTLVQGALLEKPMVSFNVLGANELIKNNGFIVPQKNINEFVEKLTFLINNPERAKELGKKGRFLVNEEWKIEEIQKRNEQLYQNLLSSVKLLK
jgi:glycosyltransferase involved in cell wall biosynthesis